MEVDKTKFPNEYQIRMKWRIKEEDLKDMQKGYLQSKTFKANIPGIEYYLLLNPNGRNESERNQVGVYLHLKFHLTKQINADYTISVKSASQNLTYTNVAFKCPIGWGGKLCTRDDMLNPEKKYFVDGIMEIVLEGSLKSQGIIRTASIPYYLGKLLFNNDEDKDVRIVVGDKEIKVHKLILTACSPVFEAELFHEATENKIVISGFCYETVRMAIMFCYQFQICDCDGFEERASEILHFANKYGMKKLHDYLQAKFIKMMSEKNVVRFSNASITSNSSELREFSIWFLANAAKQSTIIGDIKDLKDEIRSEVFPRLYRFDSLNECRIEMKWKIKEEDLKDMQEDCLQSKTYKADIPGAEYFLQLYPNGKNESERNQVGVYFLLNCGIAKENNASFTISVKSASKDLTFTNEVFEEFQYWGNTLCTLDDMLNPVKKFFVDGIMEVEVEGLFKSQSIQIDDVCSYFLGKLLFDNDEHKDVAIVVGEDHIMVHKLILTACSPVFNAELNNPRFNEAAENKIVISDFCFGVVKNAVHFCYESHIARYENFEETAFELLRFADKYDMKDFHQYLQFKFIEMMSEENVVEYANAYVTSNSADLREFCICFLINAAKNSKVIKDMEKLDEEIAIEYNRRSLLSASE